MKNVLVLGKGFLGKEFEKAGYTVWGRDKFVWHGASAATFDAREFDVIINCIGMSNTRACEADHQEALFINAKLPAFLSAYCRCHDKRFVQISTGCLYDTWEFPNTEKDFIVAHCLYTVSKWLGEKNCDPFFDLIIRPRLYFSDVQDKNNLLCKIPNFKSYTRGALDSLTSTKTIVEAVTALLEANKTGVFNVAEEGTATIAQIAEWCGIENPPTHTADELRKQEGLFLVNNTMDLSKLKQFYHPPLLEKRIKECYNKLYEGSNTQKASD